MSAEWIDTEINVTWRKTVSHRFTTSRHFFLAIIFNLLNFIALLNLYKQVKNVPTYQPYIGGFILLYIFFLSYAGYYMWSVYKVVHPLFQVENSMPEPSNRAVLSLSYLAFRLYLTALCFSFFIVSSFAYVLNR